MAPAEACRCASWTVAVAVGSTVIPGKRAWPAAELILLTVGLTRIDSMYRHETVRYRLCETRTLDWREQGGGACARNDEGVVGQAAKEGQV